MEPNTLNSNFLSLPQVAERLGISRQAVHLAVQGDRLKAQRVTLGGRTVFLVALSEVERFAEERKTEAEKPPTPSRKAKKTK